MSIYTFHRGSLPLLISVPHAGTAVPDEIARTFTRSGLELPDTDWYVDRLYGFAEELGASVIRASVSRYVVDLNRGPDSASLYTAAVTSPCVRRRHLPARPSMNRGGSLTRMPSLPASSTTG